MAKPVDRKLTFRGIDKSYIVGALCTQIGQMTSMPFCHPVRDVERTIQLLVEARAAIGTANLDVATNSRIERVIEAAERAIAGGKFAPDNQPSA